MVGVSIDLLFSISALNWSQRERLRLAVSSQHDASIGFDVGIIEVNLSDIQEPVMYNLPLNLRSNPDDLAFIYDPEMRYPDLLATASDRLRLWQIDGPSAQLRHAFPNVSPIHYNAYAHVIEWNRDVPWRMAVLYSEGAAVVWNLEEVRPETTVMVPDAKNEIFIHDMSWGGHHVLAAGYDDGRLQILDFRTRRSNGIYSVNGGRYIHRVEWSDLYPNYLAMTMGGDELVVLDPRRPGSEVAVMQPHGGEDVHAMAWDPTKGTRFCSAGGDLRVAVCDITAQGYPEFFADYPADNDALMKLKWSFLEPYWLAYTCGDTLELVEVAQGLVGDDVF